MAERSESNRGYTWTTEHIPFRVWLDAALYIQYIDELGDKYLTIFCHLFPPFPQPSCHSQSNPSGSQHRRGQAVNPPSRLTGLTECFSQEQETHARMLQSDRTSTPFESRWYGLGLIRVEGMASESVPVQAQVVNSLIRVDK